MSSVLDRLTDSADVFVDPALFGVAATYTPAGTTTSTTINVTFSEPGTIEKPQGIDGETTQPAALARSVDVASAKYGDKLVISGTTYRVTAAVPDGSGLTTLWLTADAAMQVPVAPHTLATDYVAGSLAQTVNLTWVNPSAAIIQVWRQRNEDDIELIYTTTSGATSYTDATADDAVFTYHVVAINDAGPSAPSNELAVDTTI